MVEQYIQYEKDIMAVIILLFILAIIWFAKWLNNR